LPLSLLLIGGCNSGKEEMKDKAIVYEIPQGTIQLDSNFFVDTTEIRNHDWLEYLYWTGRIFGINSTAYKAALPDTTVWESPNEDNIDYYLRHPIYREYPVAGITYQQAINFSKWRSDRVFQINLVDKKILTWNDNEDSTNYFTIERYYEGKYYNIKPDLNILYPLYALPNLDEWNYIISKTEAFNKNDIYVEEKKLDNRKVEYEIKSSENEKPKEDKDRVYTVPVNKDPKSKIIFHLYDNVSEISKDKGIALGGNWNLTNKGIYGNIISSFDKPNSWTGFRNVCRWKKYNAN
jgi:hypothetical protein